MRVPKYIRTWNNFAKEVKGNYRTWRNWLAYCRLLDDLDYRCNFREGVCKEHKNQFWIRTGKYGSNSIRCYCVNCYRTYGYLNFRDRVLSFIYRANSSAAKETLALWKKEYKRDIGFWREGEGCCLPRWARSDVCQSYNCFPQFNQQRLEVFNQIIFWTSVREMIPVRELRTLARKNGLLSEKRI